MSNGDDEWAEQAQQYFAKNLFAEAGFCFQRARMPWWSSVAQTYKHRQDALRLADDDPIRLHSLRIVAQIFDHLATDGRGKEDEESLRLLFANAGECYAAVGEHPSAGVSFLNARKYTPSAYHYRMAGLFEEALDIIKNHRVDSDVADGITYAAKIVFTKRGDPVSLQYVAPCSAVFEAHIPSYTGRPGSFARIRMNTSTSS